jgi:hypothetical protein
MPLQQYVLIGISLASLLFLDVWSYIESPYLSYFLPPSLVPINGRIVMLIAALLDIAVLACIFVVVARLVENIEPLRAARDAIFLLLLLIPINMLRKRYHLFAYQSLVDHYGKLATIALILVAVFLACLAAFRRRAVVRGTAAVVMVLVPLPLLVIGQIVLQAYASVPIQLSTSLGSVNASGVSSGASRRVVWLIFDELDQYLMSEGRPAGVGLPAFDAFREISLSGVRAVRPGRDTIDAIPAALTCQKMTGADVRGSGSLILTPCNGAPHAFQSSQTVFAAARSLGLTTAVVGWYHPYCRVLADALTYCYGRPAQSQFVEEIQARNQTLPETAMFLLKRQLLQLPLAERSGLVQSPIPSREALQEERVDHLNEFTDLYDHALAAVRSPNLQFTVVHLPVPHLPGLYNRRTKQMDASGNGNYFDNLVLADKVLADVRLALEQAGLWDRTAVLVTADHPLRVSILQSLRDGSATEELRATGDRERSYIPFLLHLPQESGRAEFTDEFDSAAAGDIAVAAIAGKLTSYAGVEDELRRRGRPETCNFSKANEGGAPRF